ncbi:hypothetical protein MCOR27_000893 [Pyricularia oryzae]|nr:hypothetical protein MCOR01_008082 [Pyricularia oryzae]KAI6288574.1 hypothetical protein MCOR27_000893 [Pyricularia oryzae]KAI6330427.1 hypothetical protein MCOR30_005173 [Pyricularia oryzae]KAI6424784.1 hypothetical protein MCOR21_007578 [Pyricularia oryzae]KAI6469844.1 hypothetical protein MCOR15_001587 [Pyricularia oryzae]
MQQAFYFVLAHAVLCFRLGTAAPTEQVCRCSPGQSCWPAPEVWSKFNETVGGKLIQNTPLALPCYLGKAQDEKTCGAVTQGFNSAAFLADQPLGYDYPLNTSCPPLPFGAVQDSSCALGNSPVYTVNATKAEDVQAAIEFVKKNNLRAVIKSTGYDLLQRSTGAGSVLIWLRHLRNGVEFYEGNPELASCAEMAWNGSTLRISGSYPWADLYPMAKEKGVIVVGGNDPAASSTGGFTQGGGHSPLTRRLGLGSDQVLSARVVLASGQVVTASPCQNSDLLYAVRGGGPGTYGVVTEMLVKTFPDDKPVSVAQVTLGSNGDNKTAKFVDAMTEVYSSLPEMSKRGFSGYGSWAAYLAVGIGPKAATNVYRQTFNYFGSAEEAQQQFAPLNETLAKLKNPDENPRVSLSWTTFPNYTTFFAANKESVELVGSVSAMGSRLVSSKALDTDKEGLRRVLGVMAGKPGQSVSHWLVHHGLEHADAAVRNTSGSAQPGWYRSVLLDVYVRDMVGFNVADNLEPWSSVRGDMTTAMRERSPGTGTYMNEADWGNEFWKEDFYGENWERLRRIKKDVDPEGVFYCPTCVGSEDWVVDNGRLCRVQTV